MKTIQQLFTKTEQKQMIQAFENMSDAKKIIRNKISENLEFADYLNKTRVSDFALDLFGKEYIEKNPLYIKGIKTSLCDALYYAKKLAKTRFKTKDSTKDNTKDSTKDSTKDNTKDSTNDSTKDSTNDSTNDTTKDNTNDNTKSLVQIIADLTYIENNWKTLEKKDKDAIKLALVRLNKLK